MKKIVFIGLLVFMAGNIFCQTAAPLNKDQQKKVKNIHKQMEKSHNDVVKHPTMTAEEKKSRVHATKSERDAQLAAVLSPEQVEAVKAKDPINWDGTINKIDKQEKSRLKAERDQKLKEVDKQNSDLEGQQDDIKKQMSDLKRKQKDLDDQQKSLKQRKKEITAQYK